MGERSGVTHRHAGNCASELQPQGPSSAGFMYADTGGSGPPVIIIHGVLMNGTLWGGVVDALRGCHGSEPRDPVGDTAQHCRYGAVRKEARRSRTERQEWWGARLSRSPDHRGRGMPAVARKGAAYPASAPIAFRSAHGGVGDGQNCSARALESGTLTAARDSISERTGRCARRTGHLRRQKCTSAASRVSCALL